MARSSRRRAVLLFLSAPAAMAATLTNLPTLSTVSDGASNTGTNTVYHLTGLPTIAGAGIPKLVIPDTKDAPYMQKSSLPEGTFFIAVGATLAFLGACVLLWRAMVAWSINRSVKRSALASMGTRTEKTGSTYGAWSGGRKTSGYHGLSKASFYNDSEGTSVSMENLTSAGRQVKPHFRDSTMERLSTPPQDLFFSPTAHARESHTPTRGSAHYMPAGFYASPSSQPAGGASNTTIGGSPNRYSQHHKRHSTQGSQLSGHALPLLPDSQSQDPASRRISRDSRQGGHRGSSRDSRNIASYGNPGGSNVVSGQSAHWSDAPNRAPSAYLDELFENHGNGPRERF